MLYDLAVLKDLCLFLLGIVLPQQPLYGCRLLISYGNLGAQLLKRTAMKNMNFTSCHQLRKCSVDFPFVKWPVMYLLSESEPPRLHFSPGAITLLNFRVSGHLYNLGQLSFVKRMVALNSSFINLCPRKIGGPIIL